MGGFDRCITVVGHLREIQVGEVEREVGGPRRTIRDAGSGDQMAGTKRQKNWITVGKIGEYCQVSTATVRRWIKNGELPAIQLPSGHFRVSIADFRDFLKRHNLPVRGEFFESEPEARDPLEGRNRDD